MTEENIDPYEIIKSRFESNVNSFVLSKLFNYTKKVDYDLVEDIKKNKIAIYTAFTGDYDYLKEPEFIDDNCDYICFTNNPNLESDTWKIIQMADSTLDDNRIAKQYRLFPHKYLSDYKYSFWLDGTFKIVGSIREYVYKYVNSPMLVVVHPERDCIYDEALGSIPFERYPNYTIEKQVNDYRKMGMPEHYGLIASGALFRQHNHPDVIKLMEDWWREIIKYTNQDQLSLPYLMWKHDFHPSVSPVYYWINDYWKKEGQYHHKYKITSYLTSCNLINSLEGNIQDVNTLSKEEMNLLFNDIDALKFEVNELNIQRDYLDNKINDAKNSFSWKITEKLRSKK